MEDKEKSLIIIFISNKDTKELTVESVAVCEKDPNDSIYDIISGEFKGFSSEDFNRFKVIGIDNPFIKSNNKVKPKIEFENMYNSGNEIIYCFDSEYIKQYCSSNNKTFEEACLELSYQAYYNTITFDSKFGDLDITAMHDFHLKNNNIDIPESVISGMLKGEEEEVIKPLDEDIFSINGLKDRVSSIIDDISKKIVGQDEAIVTLVTNLFYNQLIIKEITSNYEFDSSELDSRKVGILLDGSTGTGKTAILKEIASKLDLPLCLSNANSFSETGYYGPSITDILRKLYILSGRDIKKAEKGIVVLDEIDKLASTSDDFGKDMKKGVQDELLGFISGGEYDFPLEDKFGSPTIHFDTSKLTFILSGAFTHLRERKIKESNKKQKTIGFGTNVNELGNNTYVIKAQDYVDEGLAREFFGRIKVLTCTKSYNFDDLRTILLTSTISPLKNLERTVKMFGYPGIIYDEEFISDVCNQALDMQTGARGLQTIMSGIQNRLLIGLINQTYDFDKPIELSINLLDEYNKSLVRKY